MKCSVCDQPMQNMGSTSESSNHYGCKVVEVFVCQCGGSKKFEYFPRYNDPYILMQTRKGRCGEWALAFKCICDALGYQTRFVYDYSDHVWVEVLQRQSLRWLHCDPCENLVDKPLLYECGWGKKLTYCIGTGLFGMQDITWRYSSDFVGAQKRRKQVREQWLCKLIYEINKIIQNDVFMRPNNQSGESCLRVDYNEQFFRHQFAVEMSELLWQKPAAEGLGGRQSGSLAWRLARGEAGADAAASHLGGFVFQLPLVTSLSPKQFVVFYSCTDDAYVCSSAQPPSSPIRGFRSSVFSCDLIRKQEFDWKMCYLARAENTERGSVEWRFNLASSGLDRIDCIQMQLPGQTFENGAIQRSAEFLTSTGSKLTSFDIPSTGELSLDRAALSSIDHRATLLAVRVHLLGGRESNAWQHAQLCRAPLVPQRASVGPSDFCDQPKLLPFLIHQQPDWWENFRQQNPNTFCVRITFS